MVARRRAETAVLLLPKTPRAYAASDAAEGPHGAFRNEEDHPTFVEHGDPHPRAELESLTGAARQDELILAGKRHGFHRLTGMLSIRVL